MRYPTQLFINGKSCGAAGGAVLAVINPASEEPLCETCAATPGDVGVAVAGAQAAFEQSWRDCPPGRRAEIMFQIARVLREHAEELSQLESLSIGKPISDARDEIAMGARTFEYYAGAISRFCGQTIPVARGGFDFALRQPMGVVAAIVPWNFPFPIAAWKVAPALNPGSDPYVPPIPLRTFNVDPAGRE